MHKVKRRNNEVSLDSRLCQALTGEPLQSDSLGDETHKGVGTRTDVKLAAHSNRHSYLKWFFNSMEHDENSSNTDDGETTQTGREDPPFLNLVIHAVGPLDEIEPFVALGMALANYGHRVRIATHSLFKSIVCENGLEFFDIEGGPGDPDAGEDDGHSQTAYQSNLRKENSYFTVAEVSKILDGCWRSCFENSDQFMEVDNTSATTYFLANAIIASPASLGHMHCAEKLGIPLQLMSTYPCSPTKNFPHPIVNIGPSSFNDGIMNYLSYLIVESSAWKRIGNEINRFRQLTLQLPPLNITLMPYFTQRNAIPHIYCWSPSLLPKPKDWNPSAVVSGFISLPTKVMSTPPIDLAKFITSGTPPIYIDLSSTVIEKFQPNISILANAAHLAGLRAIIRVVREECKSFQDNTSSNIYLLTSPLDKSLLRKSCCVVHCGSIGLTAAVLAAGKPSVIVPFFRDETFWGRIIAKAGVGSQAVLLTDVTSQKLAAAIQTAIEPQSLLKATTLGEMAQTEDGISVAMMSLHDQFLKSRLTCSISPTKAATWKVRKTEVRLSSCAAAVLMGMGLLDFEKVELLRPCSYSQYLETRYSPVHLKFATMCPQSNDTDELQSFSFLIEYSNRKRKSTKIDLAVLPGVHKLLNDCEIQNVTPNLAMNFDSRGPRERYHEPAFDIHDCHMTEIAPHSFNGRSRGPVDFILRIDATVISGLSRSFSGLNELFHSWFKSMVSCTTKHTSKEALSAYEKALLQQGVAEAARLGEADYTHIMNQWKVATAHVRRDFIKR